jgi:hypothetical protein
MRERHNVYVIELDKDVLYEAKFKKANPEYVTGKPCVYVGMTGHDPDTRFDQHKAGIKSNKYAMKYGIRLMPEIYEKLNPMPYGDAQYMEVDLAIRLQRWGTGFGRTKRPFTQSEPHPNLSCSSGSSFPAASATL